MSWHRRTWHALCLYLLVAMSGQAIAQDNQQFADFFAAADQLDRLAGAAASAGAPPRISDPQVAALFARLTDAPHVFNHPYGMEDVRQIGPVLNRTLGFFVLYMDWGAANGLSGPARTSLENRNAVLYQDEMVPVVGFAFDAGAVLLRTVSASMTRAPAGSGAGLAQSREGVTQMVGGLLGMMVLRGVTPDHRLAYAQILARNSDDLAGALTLSQRRAMAVHLDIVRQQVGPRARAALERALGAFSSSSCTGLCAM